MLGITPEEKRPQTEEVKKEVKNSSQTDAGAVIVKMPDSNCHRGMRRWIDRKEVEEMVEREELGRGKKHSFVQTVHYGMATQSDKVTLKEGMELYFVGHGGTKGFIGQRRKKPKGPDLVKWIDENHLREWIALRRDGDKVIRLKKIKLVTCNGATWGSDGPFAGRLATALIGIVTGRVVGFSQYLLSAPGAKGSYAVEPDDASLSSDAAISRFDAFEQAQRDKLLQKFADFLLPADANELSATGVLWARKVLCRQPDKLNFLVNKFTADSNKPKPPLTRQRLVEVLTRPNSGIAWPEGNEDLEFMIEEMKKRNDNAGEFAEAKSAAELFKKVLEKIKSKAEKEWAMRKSLLLTALAKEHQKESVSAQKTPGKHLSSHRSFDIDPPPR